MLTDTIEKVLDRSANRIESMEEREARKLLRIYRESQKELQLRLLAVPSNTFTEAQMESRLLQIEHGIQALNARLKNHMKNGYENISNQGFEDSVSEVNSFEKQYLGVTNAIDIDLVLTSLEPKNYLFNRYESSVLAYNESMRSSFTNSLANGITQNKTWSQIVADISNNYSMNEYKIARIVRTELHNIYNVSKMDGFKESRDKFVPDLKKALFHPLDHRTGEDSKAARKQIKSVDIDKPFKYKYNDKEVVFMTPPDRPNDRSILMPWRNEYSKSR